MIETQAGERKIKDMAEEQLRMLYELVAVIDDLVARNKPECGEAQPTPRSIEGNIFEEIANIMGRGRGLIREATEKVQVGIAEKVH